MFKEVAAGSILEDCLDYGRLTNCRLNSCEAAAPGIICNISKTIAGQKEEMQAQQTGNAQTGRPSLLEPARSTYSQGIQSTSAGSISAKTEA
ncbi:hypothetical protein WJX84_007787 [Apatococcus fuscideae]|uniref:Uncharacterized protein n=1 Tax=Apatococcus fuscideae TaxID=2026836 RepID=A0AAW1SRQ0_9CHLO